LITNYYGLGSGKSQSIYEIAAHMNAMSSEKKMTHESVRQQVKIALLKLKHPAAYSLTLCVQVDEATPEQGWKEAARCSPGQLSQLFVGGNNAKTALIKELCEGCAVRSECLAYGTSLNAQRGIWGGVQLSRTITRRMRANQTASEAE